MYWFSENGRHTNIPKHIKEPTFSLKFKTNKGKRFLFWDSRKIVAWLDMFCKISTFPLYFQPNSQQKHNKTQMQRCPGAIILRNINYLLSITRIPFKFTWPKGQSTSVNFYKIFSPEIMWRNFTKLDHNAINVRVSSFKMCPMITAVQLRQS